MYFETPFSRNESLRREWWKFAVARGLVRPSSFFSGKVTPTEARNMKKRSVCGGCATQYSYDARTKVISGFFRPSNPMLDKKRIEESISTFLRERRQRQCKGIAEQRTKEDSKKYATEIKQTRFYHGLITKEVNRLQYLSKKAGEPSGYKRYSPFWGRDFIGMLHRRINCASYLFNKISEDANRTLDDIYLRQADALSILIQRFQPIHKMKPPTK